ncbi:MDR family MFS transporter [Shouchella lonarensis]|uniref:Predicted arabinose efflux permease, MFS family n=1 Tax=Shouchella lonarensis TaxID=1464122 RepID=A0A1G6K5T7_9BACI|nr:MFS transporter [Shouchella lonarensis]SDC26317.1 Predicted arabinose efflux permease, MFS family [Shouchella lonarensis]
MPKSMWVLIIAVVINVTGASFLWPLNAVIMHDVLGQSLTASGFVLMLNAAAGVTGNLIGGRLFDKVGVYPGLVAAITIAVISSISLALFFETYALYALFLVGIGLGSGMMMPSMYALAGSLWPDGGRRPFNAVYVAQNVGVSLGTALIAVITLVRLTDVFIANALMYVGLLIFVVIFFRPFKAQQQTTADARLQQARTSFKKQYRLHSLLLICAAFLICWIGYTQWQANVSVHMQVLGLPLPYYSLLWTINGLLIVFAQPLVKWLIHKGKLSMKGQVTTGIIVFSISYLVLTQASAFSMFLCAMLILTLGEMFVWPAVPTIASQLAPPGKSGMYQGIVGSVSTGGRMIGPLFGGMIVDHYSMHVLLMIISVLLLCALPLVRFYDCPLKKEKTEDVRLV